MAKYNRLLSILVLMILTAAASPLFGAETIHTRVVGSDDTPIFNASVVILNGDSIITGAPSDSAGFAYLKLRQPVSFPITIRTSAIGYEASEQTLDFLPSGGTLRIELVSAAVDVGRVEVWPEKRSIPIDKTIDRDEIREEARMSFVATNPIAAINEPQVIREGSGHSSKLRINGTSPTYHINGIEIGHNPNHYGVFSIIPSSVVKNMRLHAQGTAAAHDLPSVVEFTTERPYESNLDGEINISAVQATGSFKIGGKRWFALGAVRESVLDKLVKHLDISQDRRTIPPTNFQDLFLSTGLRLSTNGHLIVDQYHVRDYFSFRTDGTSNNLLGTNTSLHTSENYVGGRLELLLGRTHITTRAAVRQSNEQYDAAPVTDVNSVEPILDLDAKTRSYFFSAQARRMIDDVEITAGARSRIGARRNIDLEQNNWNFQPPDAASDNPYIYQAELNALYGSYHAGLSSTDHAGFVSTHFERGPVEFESGLRADYFGGLEENLTLSIRQQLSFNVGEQDRIRLYYGSFSESPAQKVLAPYQVLVHADYNLLRPVRTRLASVAWGRGSLRLGTFYKRLDNLPVLTPNFSRVTSDGTPQPGFLQMLSSGAARFVGADIALDVKDILDERVDLYAFYGYTHAVKRTAGVHTDYDLNAPHRFFSQLRYRLSNTVTLGSDLTVRSGYAYTPSEIESESNLSSRYTSDYYQSTLANESSNRFPINASLNLSVLFDFGSTKLSFAVANVTNRGNPIINTRDGFIYDAGILPSIGLTTRF